jgi:hypothetical protein
MLLCLKIERRLDGNLLQRFRACESGGAVLGGRPQAHGADYRFAQDAKSGYVLPEVLPVAEVAADESEPI